MRQDVLGHQLNKLAGGRFTGIWWLLHIQEFQSLSDILDALKSGELCYERGFTRYRDKRVSNFGWTKYVQLHECLGLPKPELLPTQQRIDNAVKLLKHIGYTVTPPKQNKERRRHT